MKAKTSELSGAALDWAVAKCEGWDSIDVHTSGAVELERTDSGEHQWLRCFQPSTDWAQGGPILDRIHGLLLKQWLECKPELRCQVQINNHEGDWVAFGPTLLIAAMRCYVASKLGDEVDAPEELLS